MTDPELQPSPMLLDPAESAGHLRQFEGDLAAIDSLLAYGTHLLPRLLGEHELPFKNLVVLGVLGRQALSMADGLTLLLRSGAVHAARLQARALFEVSISIQWIDLKDSERRARALYVWNLRRQLKWLERATESSPQRLLLQADMKSSGLDPTVMLTLPADVLASEKEKVYKLLRSTTYRRLNALFDQRRGKRPHDPEWYSVLLPEKPRPSLRSLAKDVGRSAEYVWVYESGSEVSHGSLFDTHVHIKPGRVSVWPLRELRSFPEVLKIGMTQMMRLYMHLIRRYLPADLPAFQAKYLSHWRSTMLAQRHVAYTLPE